MQTFISKLHILWKIVMGEGMDGWMDFHQQINLHLHLYSSFTYFYILNSSLLNHTPVFKQN